MPNPLVSVVIPTYNRLHTLPATLASVWAQTYAPLEVIVVDDGSTDGTQAYLARQTDPRLRVIMQENGGPALARNAGIAAAQGDYVRFVDSDDLLYPTAIARAVACFQAGAPTLGVVHTRLRFIAHDDTPLPTPAPFHPVQGDVFCYLLRHIESAVAFPTCTVRRSALLHVGMFRPDPTFRNAEDVELLIRLAHDYSFAFVDDVLLDYRVHDGSVQNALATAEGRLKATHYALELRRVSECLTPQEQARLLATRYHVAGVQRWRAGQRAHASKAFRAAANLTPEHARARRLYALMARFLPARVLELWQKVRG
jgi:glycosyltransferase involved in cell wall biosynthesis